VTQVLTVALFVVLAVASVATALGAAMCCEDARAKGDEADKKSSALGMFLFSALAIACALLAGLNA
jgi:nitrate reductase NapE component